MISTALLAVILRGHQGEPAAGAPHRHRRRPRLFVTSAPFRELGTAAKVVGGVTEDGNVIHWSRMVVTNEGRSTAEDVRLISLRIDAPRPLAEQPPSRELK